MTTQELPPYNFETKTYNGISVIIETNTGYFNASKMCSDNGKQWRHYRQTKQWKEIEKYAKNYIKFPASIGLVENYRTQFDVINSQNGNKS